MSERRSDSLSKLPPRASLEGALGAIPVFPLPQVVLFPDAVLPLHIFEPRYRLMLDHCLATHRALAVAHLIGGEDRHGRPRIAAVGGGAVVVQHQALADGRSNIVLLGQARLQLDELDPEPSRPFRMARATILEDLPATVPAHDRTALLATASMFASEVRKHDPQFTFDVPQATDAAQVADLCAFQLVVDAAARQAILDELDPRARVEMVLAQLALQHAAIMRPAGDRVLN